MSEFLRDLRVAFRALLNKPVFAATVAATLGLGIAANTLIFSVVNTVLLRPLPFPEPDRIMRVTESHVGFAATGVTYATFGDLGSETGTLQHLAATRPGNFTGMVNRQPEQLAGFGASVEFFNALGVAPMIGRAFLPEEDRPGAARTIILSYETWQGKFAADRGIAGKTVLVNDNPATIVGVMPRGFDYPAGAEVWVPLTAISAQRDNRRSHLLAMVARLKPGATLQAAQQELAARAKQIDQASGGVDANFTLRVTPLHRQMTATVRPALLVLFGAVGLVLLIACANAANLLLARATERRRDVAIRTALGGNRWQVVKPLLVESMLLAFIGGAAGFLLAWAGTTGLAAWSPGNIPRWEELRVDPAMLLFALGLSILTGLLPRPWPGFKPWIKSWTARWPSAGFMPRCWAASRLSR